MIEKLRKVSKIKLNSSNDINDMDKYEIICRILQDDDCFKKMKTETAYKLLEDLGFELSDVKRIYNDIIFDEI